MTADTNGNLYVTDLTRPGGKKAISYQSPRARVVPMVERIDAAVEKQAGDTTSATAMGGMASKVQAARIVMRAGIPLVIASGHKRDALARVVAGEDEGTMFVPRANKLKGRQRWIAFFHHPKGTLVVDDGAKRALREEGKSLLPPGVVRCEGQFAAADVVRICDADGTEFARGKVAFDAAAVREGRVPRTELVHRDNLVIL